MAKNNSLHPNSNGETDDSPNMLVYRKVGLSNKYLDCLWLLLNKTTMMSFVVSTVLGKE